MPTETQKNFRRQMKEIKKDLKSKNQEEYYSYIENAHIKNYYSSSRKKVITISFAGFLTLAYFVYSLYSWMSPLVTNRSKGINTSISSSALIGSNSSVAMKHSEIVKYIEQISSYDRVIMPYLNSTIAELNDVLNKRMEKLIFIQNSDSRIKQIENAALHLSEITVPQEFKAFHLTILNKFNTLSSEITFCAEAISSYSLSSANTIKSLSNKVDSLSKQQRELLLKAFDATGIKYEVNNENIKFYYQK